MSKKKQVEEEMRMFSAGTKPASHAKSDLEGFSNEYDDFLAALGKDDNLNVGGRPMSAERLKSVFNNYFRKEAEGLRDLLSAREDMGLEYAMSQIFSPKQKELFLKKLKGEKLTKTEKEYFSSTVKKKVLALANPALHRLSQKMLE